MKETTPKDNSDQLGSIIEPIVNGLKRIKDLEAEIKIIEIQQQQSAGKIDLDIEIQRARIAYQKSLVILSQLAASLTQNSKE